MWQLQDPVRCARSGSLRVSGVRFGEHGSVGYRRRFAAADEPGDAATGSTPSGPGTTFTADLLPGVRVQLHRRGHRRRRLPELRSRGEDRIRCAVRRSVTMADAIRRLEGHRYIGVRDSMLVFDSEDAEQRVELDELIGLRNLIDRTLISTFAPDTLAEARNRGFRPR